MRHVFASGARKYAESRFQIGPVGVRTSPRGVAGIKPSAGSAVFGIEGIQGFLGTWAEEAKIYFCPACRPNDRLGCLLLPLTNGVVWSLI